MNRKVLLPIMLVVTICLLMVTAGCKKSEEIIEPEPLPSSGELQSFGECKYGGGVSGSPDMVMASQRVECIEFQYNSQGTLTFTHINASFNCCPGDITAEITFSGNTITITEFESEQSCKCKCLYDLDYELLNLAAGTYTIRIVGPYTGGENGMEFDVNLSPGNSNTRCVDRDEYPWITN